MEATFNLEPQALCFKKIHILKDLHVARAGLIMELAKRLTAKGQAIAYVADAPVFHHQESWAQVRRRTEREAFAVRSIMLEVHLSRSDLLRCVVSSVLGDWRGAAINGVRSTRCMDMLRYRWHQYLGSYKAMMTTGCCPSPQKSSFSIPNT